MTSIQIKYFCEAARCLSFTEAAARCFVTQSSLSRSISALERELGLRLFERRNNVLRLTPGGEIMAKCFSGISETLDKQLRLARTVNGTEEKSISLGLLRGEMPTDMLAAAVAAFRRAHPEMQLDIVSDSTDGLYSRLLNGELNALVLPDAALRKEKWQQSYRLCRIRSVLAVAAGSAWSSREEMNLRDFSDERFISVRPAFSDWMTLNIQNRCRAAGFEPKIVEAADISDQITRVESGHGIALLTETHADFKNPLLHFIPLRDCADVELHYVWNTQFRTAAAELFLDTLRQSIEPSLQELHGK